MYLKVEKSLNLKGKITAPSSKSHCIRALFLSLLAAGTSTINNILVSDDINDALNVCNDLGAKIAVTDNKITIRGTSLPLPMTQKKIYTGNSGLTTRFVLPILGLRANYNNPIVVDCGAQMRMRPIDSLIIALRELGLTIQYQNELNSFPLIVSGKLTGGKTEISGISSQFLSALLIALPCAELDSEITVKNLNTRPYLEMTIKWLKDQNIELTQLSKKNIDIFKIKGKQKYKEFNAKISGDFSSVSNIFAAAVLTDGNVEVNGLDMHDLQSDKRLLAILQEMGADIKVDDKNIIVKGAKNLKAINIDANDIPDLVPILAVIATCANGVTNIWNVAQARLKETDRIRSMAVGLRLMGAKIIETKDGLSIHQSKLYGNKVDGFTDHRTVMALSVAGMLAEGTTKILGSSAINKTYPGYIKTMQLLGAKMWDI